MSDIRIGLKTNNEVKNNENIQESELYWGGPSISTRVNKTVINGVKTKNKTEDDYSPEFREWYINMQAKSKNLGLSGSVNDWWWKPAMELAYPGIQFNTIEVENN